MYKTHSSFLANIEIFDIPSVQFERKLVSLIICGYKFEALKNMLSCSKSGIFENKDEFLYSDELALCINMTIIAA